jgi:hypothetical protein
LALLETGTKISTTDLSAFNIPILNESIESGLTQ